MKNDKNLTRRACSKSFGRTFDTALRKYSDGECPCIITLGADLVPGNPRRTDYLLTERVTG
jgi:hypothetical protein